MTPERSTVLVVDDAPDTLGLLDEALDGAGYIVLMAQSAASAFGVIERRSPDIILIDAVMPGMSGFEACAQLKAAPASAMIPVIFMTGLTETEHVVRALEAGATDYVTKPLQLDEVLARIKVHMATARRAGTAHAALDRAGKCLFAIDADGRLLWATPQAATLLDQGGLDVLQELGPALSAGTHALGAAIDDARLRHSAVELTFVGLSAPGELLLRISPQKLRHEYALRESLGLTLRESEVLLWLSYGKATRDIADILKLSPRTVDKHLEQIFNKLGVSNRTSAASVAMRVLGTA